MSATLLLMNLTIPRLLLLATLLAFLTACGFRPRSELVLPTDLGPVVVVSKDPNSRLADSLERRLAAVGLKLLDDAPGSPVNPDPRKPIDYSGTAVLDLKTEQWGDLPIALDSLGRAQEYSLRYAVVFEVRDADGTIAVPEQTIELQRDYVGSPTNVVGTEGERETLIKEMEREMTDSILRRMDAVYRRRQADGVPVTP